MSTTPDPHLQCRRDRQGNCMGLHCPRCGEPTGYAGCPCPPRPASQNALPPSESLSDGLEPFEPMLPGPGQVQRLLDALRASDAPSNVETAQQARTALDILRDHGDQRPDQDIMLDALWFLAEHVQQPHIRCDHA